MTTHVNKVHHVTIITKVAKDLGEDEDWLRDIAIRSGDPGGSSGSMASEKTASRRPPISVSKLLKRWSCGLRRMVTSIATLVTPHALPVGQII
ncbi:hypothetical protein ACVWWR_004536 [Bradyrhizobium sp. LM3.2]